MPFHAPLRLLTEINLNDALQAIAIDAFTTSEFPLVLSLEMHCSLPQQARICRYLQAVFGERLLLPMAPTATALPSPTELAGKVIVKAKVAPDPLSDMRLDQFSFAVRHHPTPIECITPLWRFECSPRGAATLFVAPRRGLLVP